MLQSTVIGTLKTIFGIQAETKHWQAVRTYMEQTFGTIKIDIPFEGGHVRAFFEKETLIGDDHTMRKKWNKDGTTTLALNMVEPVGTGKNAAAAIVSLWDTITSMDPEHVILQLDFILSEQNLSHQEILAGKSGHTEIVDGQVYAQYKSSQFRNGQFTSPQKVFKEGPPEREKSISDCLIISHIIGACQDGPFGKEARPSGT